MCTTAPAGTAPAYTSTTPKPPAIGGDASAAPPVSAGGATAAPDLAPILNDLSAAIAALDAAIKGSGLLGQTSGGGGSGSGCGCGQGHQGAAAVSAGGASAAPTGVTPPAEAPKVEAPKPAAQAAPAVAPAGFKLQHPVAGYKMTSPFAAVDKVRNYSPHSGTDFGNGSFGGTVKAAAPGKVVKVEYPVKGDKGGTFSGNYITIDHGNGWETKYAHLSGTAGPSVKVGDVISAGTTIGKVGSTGLSTGPHLHFMVIKDGVPQNPAPFLDGTRTF